MFYGTSSGLFVRLSDRYDHIVSGFVGTLLVPFSDVVSFVSVGSCVILASLLFGCSIDSWSCIAFQASSSISSTVSIFAVVSGLVELLSVLAVPFGCHSVGYFGCGSVAATVRFHFCSHSFGGRLVAFSSAFGLVLSVSDVWSACLAGGADHFSPLLVFWLCICFVGFGKFFPEFDCFLLVLVTALFFSLVGFLFY